MREHHALNSKLDSIEDYITLNGIPQCDYTRFTGSRETPIQRFRTVVRRLVSLKKLETKKQLNFTDLINVLGKRKKEKQLGKLVEPSLKKDSDDSVKNVARRFSKNLFMISNQLHQHEKMMESLQQLIVRGEPRNSRVLQLGRKKRFSVALTDPNQEQQVAEQSKETLLPKLQHKKTSDVIFQTRPQGHRNSLFSKQFSRGDVLSNLKTETEEIKEESETSTDSNEQDSASGEPTRNSA